MRSLFARYKAAPLSSSFFFAGILGFIITAIYYQFGKLSATYAFTFMLFFAILFIASLISMSLAPIETTVKPYQQELRLKQEVLKEIKSKSTTKGRKKIKRKVRKVKKIKKVRKKVKTRKVKKTKKRKVKKVKRRIIKKTKKKRR